MKTIGNYAVQDTPIGSGGMGLVWKGLHPDGKNVVAIKEILPQFVSNEEYRDRIMNEISFLQKLNSDHVVKIYDYFELSGSLYIVMEFVDGKNIEDYVASRGRLPWQEASRIMLDLLNAMQYVHENGIVHRDIKPGNIMVRENGEICLLDFGVAKDLSSQTTQGKRKTVVGTIIGTDGYMSPEQAQGFDIDHRADIYALGCLLFYMLTGTHAFDSTLPELEIYNAISKGEFPRLADRVKGLPSSFQKVVDQATDKNMMRRFQSCREFGAELMASLPGGTHINSVYDSGRLCVSIGRENCDISIGQQNYKVSRHHADIELKQNTGGISLVFKDCSSNGTVIDGFQLRNGMTHIIGLTDSPRIFLAGDPACQVNMEEVRLALSEKAKSLGMELPSGLKELKGSSTGASADRKTGAKRKNTDRTANDSSDSFLGAIKSCFIKYANFTGRASRAEFWWFMLFNFIIESILTLLFFLLPYEYGLPVIITSYTVSLILLVPNLAVEVRRLHDIGKSGNQIWLALIPIAGIFFAIRLLIYMFRPGQPFTNKYGPVTSKEKGK